MNITLTNNNKKKDPSSVKEGKKGYRLENEQKGKNVSMGPSEKSNSCWLSSYTMLGHAIQYTIIIILQWLTVVVSCIASVHIHSSFLACVTEYITSQKTKRIRQGKRKIEKLVTQKCLKNYTQRPSLSVKLLYLKERIHSSFSTKHTMQSAKVGSDTQKQLQKIFCCCSFFPDVTLVLTIIKNNNKISFFFFYYC